MILDTFFYTDMSRTVSKFNKSMIKLDNKFDLIYFDYGKFE